MKFTVVLIFSLFLIVPSLGAIVIEPDNERIHVTGVVEKVQSAKGLELYRLKKSYIDAPWSVAKGGWSGKNAGTQSGITISIKTSSPSVKFLFTLNDSYEDRWARMALYKDGELVITNQQAAGSAISEISASNKEGNSVLWTCVLPTFKTHYFTGVELDEGYELEVVQSEKKPIYVAVGNSITHGVGQTSYAGYLTYPWLVAKAKNYELYNFAVGGSKINTQLLDNFETITPDVISVLWGYNDVMFSSDDMGLTLERYDSLLTSLLKSFPEARVIAIELTYTTSSEGKTPGKNIERFRTEQKAVIDRLKKQFDNLISIKGLDYSDADGLKDAVHLNDDGAARLAQGIVAVLDSIVPKEPNWYVSTDGTDGVGFGTEAQPFRTIGYAMSNALPGDTVFVLPGLYQNSGFGSGEKNNSNIAYIADVHGEEGKEIVLMSSEPLGAKLQFDGSGALIFSHVSHLVIDGFEIEGPGASIDTADAKAHRLDDPVLSYYSGRGIAFWGKEGNHHITVKNNSVHHCPNSGIRANYVDYITIENNDVYSNCWWSPNAESGIVIAQATNSDDADSVKIILRKNRVWNNGNYVIYYNPNYGEGNDYGQPGFTEILDGQGLYITRSNDTYLAGKFLIENNLSVNNGINGIGFHHSNRGIIRNNTLYKNGQYPERPVSGITINGADDVLVYNNIVVGRNDAVLQNFEGSTNVSLFSNIIWEGSNSFDSGSVTADPLFVEPTLNPFSADFLLKSGSPAIDNGATPAPSTDILGNSRPAGDGVDIGAYEVLSENVLGSTGTKVYDGITLVPQKNGLYLEVVRPVSVVVTTLQGRQIFAQHIEESVTIGEEFSSGVYILNIRGDKMSKTVRFLKR